jgi:hypothetical protein
LSTEAEWESAARGVAKRFSFRTREGFLKRKSIPNPTPPLPECLEGVEAFTRFDAIMEALLSVPTEALKCRVKEYQKKSMQIRGDGVQSERSRLPRFTTNPINWRGRDWIGRFLAADVLFRPLPEASFRGRRKFRMQIRHSRFRSSSGQTSPSYPRATPGWPNVYGASSTKRTFE